MRVEFCEIGQVDEHKLKFAVIVASYEDKWVFVKHKLRDTWEVPGGHREEGENINDTGKRELFEETGAKAFEIKPVCDYSVTIETTQSYGRLFYSKIIELGDLPDLEIGEVKLFNGLPEKLTYPDIQPHLYKKILSFINF